MRKVTVAQLRNDFPSVNAMLENGESLEITKRGRVVGRLSPPPRAKSKQVKPDIMAQLKEVWGDRMFTEAEVKAMRDFEREGEQG